MTNTIIGMPVNRQISPTPKPRSRHSLIFIPREYPVVSPRGRALEKVCRRSRLFAERTRPDTLRSCRRVGFIFSIVILLTMLGFGLVDLWKTTFSKNIASFQPEHGKTIFFKTSDGVALAASLYEPERPKHAVLLVPMLLGSRKDWHDFAVSLLEHQQLVLAVDFRGHGDSSGTYEEFGFQDAPLLEQDLDAALRKLKELAPELPVILVGADLGASLSIKTAARESEMVQGVALLSPGMNIRGVDLSGDIQRVNQRLLIIVSQEDEYAYASSLTLFNQASSKNKSIKNLLNAGHGTNMLEKNVDLQQGLMNWIFQQQKG